MGNFEITPEIEIIANRKKLEAAILNKIKQNKEFEEILINDPHGALKQLGFELPDVKVNIVREKDGEFLIVMPKTFPEGEISKED